MSGSVNSSTAAASSLSAIRIRLFLVTAYFNGAVLPVDVTDEAPTARADVPHSMLGRVVALQQLGQVSRKPSLDRD